MSNAPANKPVIGFTLGDVNGIGPELIIKTLADSRITDLCTPVVFGSPKVINFYRKSIPDVNFTFTPIRDLTRPNLKQPNILSCWEEDVNITPGVMNEVGGHYAGKSLLTAAEYLKTGELDALVTAPIHKKNVQNPDFNFTGHTPFLQHFFGVPDVLMFMVAENIRVGLVTEHVPVQDIARYITKEAILSKILLMHNSLKKDFGIDKPRIAVLGLNPHAGDEGLIGKEEETVIRPAIKDARYKNILAIGPYSADAFFARHHYESFDGVLAMYHDQGLIPFKSLAIGEGVNYTAGLPAIRTSPDHGTAFDIAGKNQADHSSFLAAIFEATDIWRRRNNYEVYRRNPLKKITAAMLANAVDEKIELEEG
jgi:4-phospho-D-threonate 3-dehydrogenase / 4-phospho-D-erythronate 3-dehydrogenase